MIDLEKTLRHTQINPPFVVSTNFLREHGFPVFGVIYHVDEDDDFHIIFSRGYRNCPEEFQTKTVVCAGMKGSLHIARGSKVKPETHHDWLVRLKEHLWLPLKYLFQLRRGQDIVGLFANQYTVTRKIKPATDIVPVSTPLRFHHVAAWGQASLKKRNAIRFQVPCTLMVNMISGGECFFATLVGVHPVSMQCVILPWAEENSNVPLFGDVQIPLQKFENKDAIWYIRACPAIWIPLEEAIDQHVIYNPPGVEKLFSTAIKGKIKDQTSRPLIPYSLMMPQTMEEYYIKMLPQLGETWGHRISGHRAHPFFGIHVIPSSWVIHDNAVPCPTPPSLAPPPPPVFKEIPKAPMIHALVEPYYQINKTELLSWESQVRDAVTPSPGYTFLRHSLPIHDHHITNEKVLALQEPIIKAKEPKVATFWISEMPRFDCFGEPPILINPAFVEAANKVSQQHKREIKELVEDDQPSKKKRKSSSHLLASSFIQMDEDPVALQETPSEEDQEMIRLATIALYRQSGKEIPPDLLVKTR